MSWGEIKKARQRLAREQGTVFKDWGGKLPFALIYPNSYYVGMSNLGVHTIYRLLNGYADIVCERAFWEPEGREQPAVLSLESQRPLSDFAVLAFSISYELDFLNVVPILRAAGIPLFSADRDERHPLVIAGGPCVITNPLPISPFFDCLCIGEAETILPGMLPVLAEGLKEERSGLLRKLASLPGLYVPQYFSDAPVRRQWAADLDAFPVASVLVTPDTELGDLYLIEVERGCNWACGFCLVSRAFRPIRFHSLESLLAQARHGLKFRKRLGLVGPAVTAHPQIEELLEALTKLGAGLSISSLRIKPLSRRVLELLVRGGARTLTLAPEAGSERLRRLIGKGISEDDILKAVDTVSKLGVKSLKLYFMFGLPSETDEDADEITRLALAMRGIVDKQQPGCRLTLNLAPFIPKAGMPFQRLPMAPPPILKRRLSWIKNTLEPRGIKIKSESPAWSEVQTVLSRGDASLAGVLASLDGVSLAGWRRAAAECGLDIDLFAYREWGAKQRLPWSVIDTRVPA